MNIARLAAYIKISNKKINFDIGEVLIVKQIGQGGNGIVYECNCNEMPLAIKFLVTDAVGNTKKQKIQRFVAEYFNVVQLDNLNQIVRYIDYDVLKFTDESGEIEIPVILMKLYDGSISALQKPTTFEAFVKLFNFLIDVAEYIHSKGIIHRDIKPENVLFLAENFYLADFGISSFNPEMFKIHADTQKNERIGNRLFSAPEQEENGVAAHETMDIYAIGQLCQWFVTGSTHRGTNRQLLSDFFDKDKSEIVKPYDAIINKCLENNPNNRFQSINDIREFLQESTYKGAYDYLDIFHEICVSNFPKNETGIVHSSDIPRIDSLLLALNRKEKELGNNLWWTNGSSDMYFKLKQKSNGVWKINNREHIINKIWLFYDEATYNDFILLQYIAAQPFELNGEVIYYTGIVDDKHHISFSEYNNGYAEIDGKIIKLSEHKTEWIDRDKSSGFFFIGTKFNCLLRWQNKNVIKNYLSSLAVEQNVDEETLLAFAEKIREYIHDDVETGL